MPSLLKSQRYLALWFGCTVAEKVTRTMSPLTQLWLTTKALAVSACAVGAAIALNTRAKEAITIYLIHRFCFIIYLVPILLRKETKPLSQLVPSVAAIFLAPCNRVALSGNFH